MKELAEEGEPLRSLKADIKVRHPLSWQALKEGR